MNVFTKVKLFFAVSSSAEKIKGAYMDSTVKPGWKTSEFWGKVAVQLGVLWGAVQGFVPPKYAAIITVAGEAIYTLARSGVKVVGMVQATKAQTATVTTTAPVTTVTAPA